MQIIDVPWISHDGGNIFSLDLHPTGTKLATAGQDGSGAGLLTVWDLEFLSSPNLSSANQAQCSYNPNPMARIPHSSSINCVRWSKHSEGRRLACGGDDPVLCIYECTGAFTSMGSIGQQQPAVKRNVENYKCVHKLFGHTLDVMHLDFSSDGKYLASCSLDNSVIVWNALRLPEKVAVLREANGGHTRGVKGLAWDPLGRFLATQAEDKCLKIWATDSWRCLRTLHEPFVDSAISTLFYRMDWAPDGSFLVVPSAMNNGAPTARLIARQDCSTITKDLVGFRKAVACVRSNPHCFQRRMNSSYIHSAIAVGSRDRSLSIWLLPRFGRPLLVMERLFKDSVVDMSWSELTLAACSRTGVVIILRFSDSEIGHMLSAQETEAISRQIYGIQPSAPSPVENGHLANGISSDFGQTSNCGEAIARRASISEPGMAFKQAPSPSPPPQRRRDSGDCMLHSVARMALKRQRLGEPSSSFAAGQQVDEKPLGLETAQQNGHRHQPPDDDDEFIGAKSSSSDLRPNNERRRAESSHLFELPEQRRQLTLIVGPVGEEAESASGKQHSPGVDSVELVNNFQGQRDMARVQAYRRDRRPVWTVLCPRLVSILAANRRWTLVATFDAHFLAISTKTGRLFFDLCLEESLAIVQLQAEGEEDLNRCLTIGVGGALSLWDLPNRRRGAHLNSQQQQS